MAKVNANLADVSTERRLAPPENYRLKVKEIKEKNEGGRQNFNFEIAVNEGEFAGVVMFHNVSMHLKSGDPNTAGAADLKRFFLAILGIDPEDDTYDWDNVDTDDLKNGEFTADVVIEAWVKDKGQPTEKKGQSNKINSYTIAPLN